MEENGERKKVKLSCRNWDYGCIEKGAQVRHIINEKMQTIKLNIARKYKMEINIIDLRNGAHYFILNTF